LGRKTMLSLPLLIMGLGTRARGLLPTYASLGFSAQILHVSMRLLQGLGIGGDWGAAEVRALVHAPADGPRVFRDVLQVGGVTGSPKTGCSTCSRRSRSPMSQPSSR